jgi:hypothetical protein
MPHPPQFSGSTFSWTHVPPQFVQSAGQELWHIPFEHQYSAFAGATVLQVKAVHPPHTFELELVSTQVPPQSVNPLWHAVPQVPPTHA